MDGAPERIAPGILPSAPAGPRCARPKSLPAILSNLELLIKSLSHTIQQKTRLVAGCLMDGAPERIAPGILPSAPAGPRCARPKSLPAILSNLELLIKSLSHTIQQKTRLVAGCLMDGAPERIRTSDRSVRSRVLYPAELQAHVL